MILCPEKNGNLKTWSSLAKQLNKMRWHASKMLHAWQWKTYFNRPQKTLKTRKIFIAPQETNQRPPNNLSPRSEKLKEQSLGVHRKKQAREKKTSDLLFLTPNIKNTPDGRIDARTTQQIYQNNPESIHTFPLFLPLQNHLKSTQNNSPRHSNEPPTKPS